MAKQEKLKIKSNEGVWIISEDNKKYLDFGSIIFTCNLGGNNFDVHEAIMTQLNSNNMFAYHYPTSVREEAEELLRQKSGMSDSVFYCSGTDANEAALKIIQARNPQMHYILSLEGCFYGRSWGGELLNGRYKHGSFVQLPFPEESSDFLRDLAMTRVSPESIGGIFVQSYRGYDGAIVPTSYMKQVEKFCNDHSIVFAMDDIQAGGGRCGTLFSYDRVEVRPDLVTIGKFLGNGVPISAVAGRKDLFDNCRELLSSTHGGWPLGCAAAVAVLKNIEKSIENAEYDYFEERCDSLKLPVSRVGLMGAIVMDSEISATRLCDRCFQNGLLLIHTGTNYVKMGPALTMDKATMKIAFDIIEEEIEALWK